MVATLGTSTDLTFGVYLGLLPGTPGKMEAGGGIFQKLFAAKELLCAIITGGQASVTSHEHEFMIK